MRNGQIPDTQLEIELNTFVDCWMQNVKRGANHDFLIYVVSKDGVNIKLDGEVSEREVWEEDKEFCFEHVKLEMPVKHSSLDVEKEILYIFQSSGNI